VPVGTVGFVGGVHVARRHEKPSRPSYLRVIRPEGTATKPRQPLSE